MRGIGVLASCRYLIEEWYKIRGSSLLLLYKFEGVNFGCSRTIDRSLEMSSRIEVQSMEHAFDFLSINVLSIKVSKSLSADDEM